MIEPLNSVAAITLFVGDPVKSKAFYQKVFEAAPVYEDETSAAFQFGGLIINLLSMPSAHELVQPNAVADPKAGSTFQLTIPVNDTEAVCAELRQKGVVLLNGPIDRPWGMRTAAFADPDGHVWEVAQEL